MVAREGGWRRFGVRLCLWSRGWGIGLRVIGEMIGGLFVGLADGFAPGIGAVGVDVFVLSERQSLFGLQRRKAGPSLDSGRHRVLATIALAGLKTRHYNDSGEEAPEGGAEIAGGHKAAGNGARGHRAGGSEDPPLQLTGMGGRPRGAYGTCGHR